MNAEASLLAIQARIAAACARAGRATADITLIGASKTVAAPALVPYLRAGLDHLGENYIQEGLAKQGVISQSDYPAPHWHFIGALQSNKAREAVTHFELIHTVDRVSLARELNKEAARVGKVQPVLLQVNVGAESSKAGVAPAGLADLIRQCQGLTNLRVQGLMSLPPYEEDPKAMRPHHQKLRELLLAMHRQCGLDSAEFRALSMGMSNDFEVAIEEGATHVRVGTALFGSRG